jgi:hypothetical protein
MSVQITCQCGKQLRIRDEYLAAGKVACPLCHAIMEVPPAAPVAPVQILDDQSLHVEALKEIPEIYEEPEEVVPEKRGKADKHPKSEKKKRKEARTRRHGLNKANWGLAFYYATPFLFIPALAAGTLALGLLMMSNVERLEKAVQPVTFLLISGAIFLILVGLMELPTSILCLGVADTNCRTVIIMSLVIRTFGVVLAVLVLALPDLRPWLFMGALFTMILSWVLWMSFLHLLARYLDQRDLARYVMDTLWAGVGAMIVSVGTVISFMLVIMLIVSLKVVFVQALIAFTALSIFGGIIRILAVMGKFDSLLVFFLSPTGIPYALKNLDLVGSVRMVIARRS